jgi:hypothetical protein
LRQPAELRLDHQIERVDEAACSERVFHLRESWTDVELLYRALRVHDAMLLVSSETSIQA